MTRQDVQMTRSQSGGTSTPPESTGVSRRGVLGLSAAAAALLLAGCGGDTATEADAGDGSKDAQPSQDDSSSAPAAVAALAATADVPVGSGVILEEAKIVVTQPTAGEFKAFDGICTHQSCLVSSVKANRISCACHGSSFAIADGAVLNGPATRPLDEIKVRVEGDKIVKA
jgi:Rieske Fe-S protein